jgi:hypothetical protein
LGPKVESGVVSAAGPSSSLNALGCNELVV